MGTLLIWKTSRLNQSEARHTVRDLEDLVDLLRTEFSDNMIFIEARGTDGSPRAHESRVRVSPGDLTDEDFAWLTASVKHELRGVRA